MSINRLLKSIIKIYRCSQKSIHILVFVLAFALSYYVNKYNIKLEIVLSEDIKSNILTGISILSSFFLLTLQTMKFEVLNKNFKEKKAVVDLFIWKGKKHYEESIIIRNTIFSLAINIMLLVGACFILTLFSIEYLYVLIFLIIYLFIGIIYTLILWNYFSYKAE